jgi:hypothetical protein
MKRATNLELVIAAIGLLLTLNALQALGVRPEDRISKSFIVEPGGSVRMDVDRGSIEINTTDQDKLEVIVTRKVDAWDRAKADKIFQDHEITLTQDGNQVFIGAKFKPGTTPSWRWGKPNLQVHYQVSIPKKFNVELKTAGGSIAVGDLTGNLQATTAGGNLKLGRIQGPVAAKTAGGSITLASCTDTVEVKTGGGNIHVGESAGNLVAITSGGSIHIETAKNKVMAKTSGGNIDVGEVSGVIQAETSGGSVAAAFASQPTDTCSLHTSGGNVQVKLADSVAVTLDAKTGGGNIACDLPITVQGEMKRTELRGKINGGGPTLRLTTSGGSIYIRKK